MTGPLLLVVLVLTYTGYVALTGALVFWSLVWPAGHRDARLVRLAVVGTALLVLGTLAGFVPGPAGTVGPLAGAVLFVRLAGLAAIAFGLADVLRRPVVGWRRVSALVAVGVLGLTLAPVGADRPGSVLAVVVFTLHALAVPASLGGLVALTVVLIRRETNPTLDGLAVRFSRPAVVGVLVLVVTGLVSTLTVVGGPIRPPVAYGVALAVEVVVFTTMVVLAVRGRQHARRLAFRRVHHRPEPAEAHRGTRRLAAILRIELVAAAVVLIAAATAVMVTPTR